MGDFWLRWHMQGTPPLQKSPPGNTWLEEHLNRQEHHAPHAIQQGRRLPPPSSPWSSTWECDLPESRVLNPSMADIKHTWRGGEYRKSTTRQKNNPNSGNFNHTITYVERTPAIIQCNPLILQVGKLRSRKKRQIWVNDRWILKPRPSEWVEGSIHYPTLHRPTETDKMIHKAKQDTGERECQAHIYLASTV